MRKFWFSIIFILFSIGGFSQDIRIKSWLDTSSIFIGDQICFNVEIVQPESVRLIMPEIIDTLISGIEILEQFEPDTLSDNSGGLQITNKYLITGFDTGFYEIPPLFVEQKNSKGVERYYSDYIYLEIQRVNIAPPDSTDVLFDIAGPRKAGLTPGEVLPWFLLLAVLAVAVWILLKYLRKKRVTLDDHDNMPGEPIHIVAFRELDKLERRNLYSKGEIKLYYSLLTEIIRRYIDRRYLISSMEMTSLETLDALKSAGFNNHENFEDLSEILHTADMSKFAKFKPDEKTNIRSMAKARKFVKETYKREHQENQTEIIPDISITEGEGVSDE